MEHAPVMVREAMEILKPEAHKKYLDGTLGAGGHAAEILNRSHPDGRLLGLDWDEDAIEAACERLKEYGDRLLARRANFTEAKTILDDIGWRKVDGALLDLGLSLRQIRSPERGFSFQIESRLDMRMDRRESRDAYQIVNYTHLRELERLLRQYGEEPNARRITLAIGRSRQLKPIETTTELAGIVARAARPRRASIHPATRTFQALRIAVNRELENLETFLDEAYDLLQPKGRMIIISFHSLEDRMVKNAFRKWNKSCLCPPKSPFCRCGWSRKAVLLTSRPLSPSPEEIHLNPRARSARLRAVERI